MTTNSSVEKNCCPGCLILEDRVRRLETELARKASELMEARARLVVSRTATGDLERAMRVA